MARKRQVQQKQHSARHPEKAPTAIEAPATAMPYASTAAPSTHELQSDANTTGNLPEAHVMLRTAPLDHTTADTTRHTAIRRLQRLRGNIAVQRTLGAQRAVAQRDTTTAVAVRFGPYAPETYANLYNISRTLIADLIEQLDEVEPGAPVQVEAMQWVTDMRSVLPSFQRRGEDVLDSELIAAQAPLWYAELQRLRAAIATYKQQRIIDALEAPQQALAEAGARLQAERDRLDDAVRAAFLSGDTNKMAQVANFVGTALDIGLGIHELARDMATELARVRGGTIPAAGRYTQWLNKINKVLAAANLLYSLANAQAPTELGTALNQVNNVAGAFSAGGTLLGLAPHIGLYANLYLVPLTQAIVAQLNVILDRHLHELNVVSAAIGFTVDASNEPGGQPMFDFMVQVMNAGSLNDVPESVPEPVSDYLLKQREMIASGAKSEMPTRGWWLWRRLDPQRAREWIFDHRRSLWTMFYGSMSVPGPHGEPGRRP